MMMMMMNSASSGGVDHGPDSHGMGGMLMSAGQPGPPPLAPGMSQMEVLRKGPWMPEEDEILVEYVKQYGPRDWSSIRAKGLLPRTGKSCRLRWVNKLKPDLKRSGCKFSPEEEKLVVEMQAKLGNKWAKIASYLPGRTDNDVKNFWSTRQKRLLRALQRPKGSDSTSPSMHANMHLGNHNDMDPTLDHLNKAHCFNEFASFQVHSPTGGMVHPNSGFGHGFFGEDDETDLFIRGQTIRRNPAGTNYNNMGGQVPHHLLGPMGGVDDVFMVKLQDLVPNESVATFMTETSSSLINENGCMSGSSSLNNRNSILGMQDGATSAMALLGSETTSTLTITPTPSMRMNGAPPKASRTVKNTRRPRSRRSDHPSNANYRATLLESAMAQISENADLKLLQLDETMAQLQQQILQPFDLDVTHNPLDDHDFKPPNICNIISGMPSQVVDLYIDASSDQSHNNYLDFIMQYDSCCTTTSTSPNRPSSPGLGLCCSPDLDNDVRLTLSQWDKLPGLLYPCIDEPTLPLQPEDMACSTLSMNIKEEMMDTKSCTPDSVLASFPNDVFDSLEPLSPSSSDWWQN